MPNTRFPARLSTLGLTLFALAPTPGVAQRATAAVIDSLSSAEFHARPMAGLQVVVVRGSDTLFEHSYGYADLEHHVPLGGDGVFQVASVTKEFTAAAVLKLVEAGRVGLDDDVRRYLPELDTQGHIVRIREMLDHTSGIPNLYEMTSWPRIRPLRLPRARIRELEMAGTAEDSLDFAPGTHFHYSNTGYDLLGDVIEKVTGQDVATFFRHELFEPLGLEHTSFCPWTRIIPNRVRGYEPDSSGTALENAWRQSQSVLFTSGGICSTASDLLAWNDALHNGRVLSPASYEAMTTPAKNAGSYGYGIYVNRVGGHRRLEHNGSTPGYATQLEYYPDDDLGVVVLANSPAKVAGLAESIGRAVLGLPPAEGPVRPKGWKVRALEASVDTTAINFETMGAGMHVTGGPGALYYDPNNVGTGSYVLQAALIEYGSPDPDGGRGLLFGGRGLTASQGRYLAFLVRRPGEYALVRSTGGPGGTPELIVPWTPSPAVRVTGSGRNSLSVRVSGSRVVLSINDIEVRTLGRDEVGDTDGVVGLWMGADDSVHIAGFGIVGGG